MGTKRLNPKSAGHKKIDWSVQYDEEHQTSVKKRELENNSWNSFIKDIIS